MTTVSPKMTKIFSGAFGFFIAVFLLTAARSLPLCWDEGDTFDRVISVQNWFSGLVSENLEAPFAEKTLQAAFPNIVSREGHPAGYVIIAALGRHIAGYLPFLSEKIQWRFGPILLFSLACGAVFYRVNRIGESRFLYGFFAAAAMLLIPRLFVHTQLTFCDSVLISGWLMSWAFFFPALEKKRYAALFGVCLGLTASAKFSGLLAALPFAFFWGHRIFTGTDPVNKRRQTAQILTAGLTGGAVFLLLNPPLWHHPIDGISTFFYLNTHRGAYNIAIQFLGSTYNLDRHLPWWNTAFWTAATVPPGLFLAFSGYIFGKKGKKAQNQAAVLALLNGLTLLTVRAFPGLPVHDGVRLFIPTFAFIGILAGIGLGRLWEREKPVLRLAALLFLAWGATESVLYFPNGLSYYSPVIGSLAGAQRLGMESTYYWDSLNRETLDWLNRKTDFDGSAAGKREILLFSPSSTATFSRYREWGLLKPDFITVQTWVSRRGGRSADFPKIKWYILQTREGALSAADRRLIREYKPAYAVKVRPDTEPVLRIFAYRDFLKAVAAEKKLEYPVK